MSLSQVMNHTARASALILAGTNLASAQELPSWEAYSFFNYSDGGEATIAAPTAELIGNTGFLSDYYPSHVFFEEHVTSSLSFGLGFVREVESNPGQDGFFTRRGAEIQYSQSEGYVVAGVGQFVDHVAAGISRDIYGVWSRYSGDYQDRLTESQINGAVRDSLDVALRYLADNPDVSFDADRVELPSHLPSHVQGEIRQALGELETRVNDVTSSDAFEDVLEFASIYQNPVRDMEVHSLEVSAFYDIGYRNYVSDNPLGVESFDVFAGLSTGYEVNYLNVEDLGGAVCHGTTASLRAGGSANFESSARLDIFAERSFSPDQDCMGGGVRAIESSNTTTFNIEFVKEF